MPARMHRLSALAVALLVGCSEQPIPTSVADDGLPTPQLSSSSNACDSRNNNTVDKLLECVTLDGVRTHQAALQSIADGNGGTRVSGFPGFDASAQYVRAQLEQAGYSVTLQPFQYQTFVNLSPSLLQQLSPLIGAVAHTILAYSGSGDETAAVSTLASPLGCNAGDWAGFPAGNIALILRGSCTFALKAANAYAAGARGVVIYNNVAGNFSGTLGTGFALDIPVVSVSQSDGQQLAGLAGLVMRIKTSTFRGLVTTNNVIAETVDGDPDNVIMVGAHLDGVNLSPGINDNGSGVAAVLETAIQMAKVKPRNKVRFAWWGAMESGLLGSTHYVNNLSADDLNRITLYLNFDAIGSPNHVFFILDGDDSDNIGAGAGPGGSAEVESVFAAFFDQRGLPHKGTDLNGTSDFIVFSGAGIPVGGLTTGGIAAKTPAEAALWGGTAGQSYDPCYHLACDTFANVNLNALDVNADAVASATLSFAMNTELVNGIKGKGNFKVKGNGPTSTSNAAPER